MAITEVGGAVLATYSEIPIAGKLSRWQWWVLVLLNIFFLVVGQTAAVLLGRYYYDQGGGSTLLATLVQTVGFPVLFAPLCFLSHSNNTPTPPDALSPRYMCLIYISLGLLVALDNYLYSKGLLYLSASTYSLICASQLAFNAIFAFFINSQRLTPLILNAVVVLTYSAALLGVNEESDAPPGVSKSEYVVGFLCTLGASAIYSLLLSLMQLTFQRGLKQETFRVVIEMQIYTSVVASMASLVGLFLSGQWRTLTGEMHRYQSGIVSYVMTLLWTGVCWQVASVGVVGLIFLVSSLFSNAISTVALAVGPLASLFVFHDKMNAIKIIAMLQALWGFASYLYQNFIDETRTRLSRTQTQVAAQV